MEITLNDLLFALSTALDFAEQELTGSTTYHSKRVAYISMRIAEAFGIPPNEKLYLSSAAMLHDNAITEYIQEERRGGTSPGLLSESPSFGKHCSMGEKNISLLSIYPHVEGAILYHHERADGGGPFGKTAAKTPLYARIIHFADTLDTRFDLKTASSERYEKIIAFVKEKNGVLFDTDCINAFLSVFSRDMLLEMTDERVESELRRGLPVLKWNFEGSELIDLSTMFAKIIDYKSHFTSRHSLGIAEKAMKMAQYYGWDAVTQRKLFFAGALHDVGKLMVSNDILEKPDSLTPEEYEEIQTHATGTYDILSSIEGLEEITSWASLHHEKLDGNGYPFGRKAQELGHKERLMACVDIYQALTEPRPYKSGLSHSRSMEIINQMAKKINLTPK